MTNFEVIHEKMTGATFRPGVYGCYANAEYHADSALSKSSLDLIHRSPAHYRAALTAPHVETAACKLGTALHTAVLEPERFSAEYTVIDGDRRLKATKEAIAEAEAGGKTVMAREDFETVSGMARAVWSTANANTFIKGALVEHSVFAELNGVRVKCRPDAWNTHYGVIIDLKTTEDASPRAFAASCRKYRYYVQDAWYRHVIALATECNADSDLSFVFCTVEKKPPYAVAWYTLSVDDAAQGWNEALSDVQVFKNARDSGIWPGYSPKIEVLQLFNR